MNNETKIKQILLNGAYVTVQDIKNAEDYSKKYHTSIIDYLLAEKLITKDLLGQAIAESFGVSYADLNTYIPPREQVLRIPENVAKKYRIVIFRETKTSATLATDNPSQPKLLEELKRAFKEKKVSLAYSLSEDIDAVFVYYRKALETRFSKIIASRRRLAPEFINEIFEDALIFHASDIHLEPQEQEIIIRFRIDGVLHEAGRIKSEHYENILNRIKVLAHLRTDEHFSAQDGAIRYNTQGRSIDMRISIAPILDGEKIVIRVLSEYVRGFTLNDLGLSPYNQKILIDAAKKPFGMILVTGPTGSGKTTTLYGLIKVLNRPEINIATIEDPVEYKIVGVNHIQVNPATNLTFTKGLKSIIRQDPNIILVGEIRDQETVDIATNAALTGHLLLSTFHANDAATSIPRLLDMGVEPFLLASTLELVVAQRLVRRICESCRASHEIKLDELKKLIPNVQNYFSDGEVTTYKGKGCNICNNTGYHGRIAIFEFIRVTPEMKELILKNPPTNDVWKLARAQGARSMFEDGMEKVKTGITTIEELLRVVELK